MTKLRRNNLDKENFLEGVRQRWCAVYTVIGLLVGLATAYGWITDPAPFMTYFTGIGVTFILGASASDIMKSYAVKSQADNTITTQTINTHQIIDETTKSHNINEDRIYTCEKLDPKDILGDDDELQ